MLHGLESFGVNFFAKLFVQVTNSNNPERGGGGGATRDDDSENDMLKEPWTLF